VARLIALWLVAGALGGCATSPSQRVLAAVAPVARGAAAQIRVAEAAGQLSAGAARVELILPAGTPLAGYARRGGTPSTGTRDPLYARALALSDGDDLIFLISADLLLVPPGFAAEVARRLDAALPAAVGPEDLLLCATHTHSGPGAYLPGPLGRMAAGAYQAPVAERLLATCVEAGLAAARAMRPARIGVAQAMVPDLIENRVDAHGPVDPQLTVLSVVGIDARPIATVMNFAAHPTLLSSKNLAFSADFPGVACRILEDRQPGTVALFTNGAAGDLRPRHLRGLHNVELAEAVGEALADATLTALGDARWRDRAELASWGGTFPLPPTRLVVGRLKMPHWLARRLVREEAFFNMVAVDDVVLVSAPGDLASEIGVRVKRWLASWGLTGVIVGYAGDYIGYVVPARWYRANPYEARMGWHGPTMEAVYEAIVINLAEEYLARAWHRRGAWHPTGPSPTAIPGLPVVILRGDPYTLGFTHGSQYRAQVQASVANIMAFVERMAPRLPFRGALVRWRLSAYYAQMEPFIPKAHREALRGLAEGSGVPLAELERVHALPEIASVWCASSVAYGRATQGGRLLHLRNLDWAIHSDVQRYAALFVYHPTGGHPFVSLGYFGFIGVLSGVNEGGISVGQVGAKSVDQTVRGLPMPFLLRRVLEEAGDLPTAIRLVQEAPRTAGFHYVFADAVRRQAVALETTQSHCAVFWAGDDAARDVPYAVPVPEVTVRADPALDPAVRDTQRCSKGDPSVPGLEPPAGKAYDVRYRQHTLMIRERYGVLDPEAMMAIAKAIAPPSNVQSIVFAFPDMWVANARGTSPAAQQPYVRYDLRTLFAHGDQFEHSEN